MKKLSHLLLIVAAAAFVFTACEGPAGPEGATGPAGPTGATGQIGPQGPAGANGADGTAGCIECHDDNMTITSKVAEWELSGHGIGATVEGEGGRASCSPCHSGDGFLLSAQDGTTGVDILAPGKINCYTCHEIHSTYTSPADWTLRREEPTAAIQSMDGTDLIVDLGAGNMCTACHQGRAQAILTSWDDGGTAVATAGSYRYGLHHGPQFNVLVGGQLYEFGAAADYTGLMSTKHILDQTDNGCVECHMTAESGHTFGFGSFPTSCNSCHAGSLALSTLVPVFQADIEDLLVELGAQLYAAGVIQSATSLYLMRDGVGGTTGNVLPQTEEHLAAAFNYIVVTEDISMGVHNPFYVETVLLNTLFEVFDWSPAVK